MSEVVTFVLIAALGASAVAFGGRIEAGFRTLNEAIYHRLPRVIGDPLLRASPVIHRAAGFIIIAWGVLCVCVGVGGAVAYLLASG